MKVLMVGCSWVGSATAACGSGPAYFPALAEALRAAAEARGLSPEIAALLAEQTLIGSAALLGRGMRPLELSQRELRAQAS